MVLGRDHTVHTGTISHPQAGAKIARISHAIEQQEQGRAVDAIEQLVQVKTWRPCFDNRNHALMPAIRTHAIQPRPLDSPCLDPCIRRCGEQVTHPAIIAATSQ
jgi:hypothetical protein